MVTEAQGIALNAKYEDLAAQRCSYRAAAPSQNGQPVVFPAMGYTVLQALAPPYKMTRIKKARSFFSTCIILEAL